MSRRNNLLGPIGATIGFTACLLILLGGLAGSVAQAQERSGEEDAARSDGVVWLGVQVQHLDDILRQALDLDGPGVLINRVVDGSPADEAGLRTGDVIARVDGRAVNSPADLRRALQRHGAGAVEIDCVRQGRERRLDAVLRARSPVPRALTPEPAWPEAHDDAAPERGVAYLGVRLAALGRDLARYFDVDAGDGVLILEVIEGSPAAAAGLRGGDVLTHLDGEELGTPAQLTRLVHDRDPGSEVTLTVVRRGRRRQLELELGRHETLRAERWNWPEFAAEDWHRLGEALQERFGRLRERLDQDPVQLERRLEQLEDLVRHLQDELTRLKEQDDE